MNARQSHLAGLGLLRNPFPPTPDAGCYFFTPHLDEQMVELAHCILSRKGFCLLTAEVGMGKSTLVRRLISDLAPKSVVSALVFNTFLQGPELLAAVLQDFGLQSAGTLSADIAELNGFLLKNHHEGKTCLLIIDDAQNLSEDSLELVRLLCNLETDQEKLLQILLTGQPELEEALSRHNLRQLRSRVVKHTRLHGLGSTEAADYVAFRFASAGSDGSLILQADACEMLWQETQGVPRQMHLVLDRCLYGLAVKASRVIDRDLMQQATADSRVELQAALPAAAEVRAPAPRPRGASLRLATGLALLLVLLVWFWSGPVHMREAWTRVDDTEHSPRTAAVASPVEAIDRNAPVVDESLANTRAPSASSAASFSGEGVPVPSPAEGSSCSTSSPLLPQERILVSLPLPERTEELLGARLQRLGDVCVHVQQGQTWLTWDTVRTGFDMGQRLTAARLQIALTAYGSLLPQEVDGVWGSKSQLALKQFQSGIGLTPTGDMDAMSGLLLEKFYVQEQ